VFGTF
jgi:hypothetical protein